MKKWLSVLLVLFLFACAANNEEARKNKNTNETPIQVRHVPEQKEKISLEESENISKRLANLAASVPDVQRATAIALGDYAVVAIDVDRDLDRSKVGTIKYSVAEALKEDPHGKNAVIVADPDIFRRLQEMGADIRAGRPIQGIVNELAEIVGRIMPEIPAKLEDDSPDENLEKNLKERRESIEKEQNQG